MFEVNIKRSFKASHALRNYGGGMESPHEHRWRCKVMIQSENLDEAGCVADFADVDRAMDEVVCTISDKRIHEVPALAGISASAENIAKYLYDALSELLNDGRKQVSRVAVWEDEDHSAAYFKNSGKW